MPPTNREALQGQLTDLETKLADLRRARKGFQGVLGGVRNNVIGVDEATAAMSSRDRNQAMLDLAQHGAARAAAADAGEDVGFWEGLWEGFAGSLADYGMGTARLVKDVTGNVAETFSTAVPGPMNPSVLGMGRQHESAGDAALAGVRSVADVTGITGLGQLQQGLVAQLTGVPAPPVATPELRPTPSIDAVHDGIKRAMGIPTDDIERQFYDQGMGGLGKAGIMTGNLASIFALMLATRKLPGSQSTKAIMDRRGVMSRVPTSGGAAVGGTFGMGLNLSYDMYANPEGDVLDRVGAAIKGLGGGVMTAGLLRGRPYGIVARRLHQLQTLKQLGTTRRLGAALISSPYLSVGHMTQAGLIGATIGTTTARNAGMDPASSVAAGVDMGLEWIAGDVITTRVGGAFRWGKALTNIRARAQFHMQDAFLIRAGQAGIDATLGAGAGAALAPAAGVDPQQGAIAGGLAGATGSLWRARMAGIMPKTVLKELAAGRAHKLTPDQIAAISRQILRQSTEEVADEMDDPAMAQILRHGIARGQQINQDRAGILAQIHKLESEMTTLTQGEQMPLDPTKLGMLVRRSQAIGQLRDRLHNLMKEEYSDLDSLMAAQGKNARDRVKFQRMGMEAQDGLDAQTARRAQARNVREARISEATKRWQDGKLAQEAESAMEVRQQLRRQFNEDFTAASESVAGLSMADIRREITHATGETLDELNQRIDRGDIEGLIGELAHLRASAGKPTTPITAGVRQVEGTVAELTLTKKRIDGMADDLDDLAARSASGNPILPEHIRPMIKRAGGGSLRREPGTPYYRAKLPFVGDIVDTLPAIVRKARIYLRDHRVGMASLGPLSAGNVLVTNDDGSEGAAWLGKATALAGLAAVGITLTRGVPTQYRGMFRQMRRWLADQNTRQPIIRSAIKQDPRDFTDLPTATVGREGIITFFDDGTASIISGKTHSVPRHRVDRRAKGRGIAIALHNHPPLDTKTNRLLRYAAAEMGVKRRLTADEESLIDEGLNVRNSLPSKQDFSVTMDMNKNSEIMFLGIMTPGETINLYSFQNPAKGTKFRIAEGLSNLLGPKQAAKTRSRLLDEVEDVVDEAESNALRQMHKELGLPKDEIYSAAPDMIAGIYARQKGQKAAEDMMHHYLRQALPGLLVIRNATDDQVERMIAQSLKSVVRTPPSAYLRDRTTQRMATEVEPQSRKLARDILNNSTYRAKVRKFLLGDPPPKDTSPTVARPGAGSVKRVLPDTLNPQMAVKAPTSLAPMQEWARTLGMTVDVVEDAGQRSFHLMNNGVSVVNSSSLTGLRSEIVGMAKSQDDAVKRAMLAGNNAGTASRSGGMTRDEFQASLSLSSGGGVAGALFGGITGGLLQNSIIAVTDPYDQENHYGGMVLGSLLGLAGGVLLGAKVANLPLTRAAKNYLRFFKPDDDTLLSPREVKAMSGKSSKAGGPTKAQFFRFPIQDQLNHLDSRIRDTINTRNIKPASRRARFDATVAAYTPSHMTVEMYDQFERMIIGGARAVGYDASESLKIMQAVAVNLATPFTLRASRKGRINLLAMAREYPAKFDADENSLEGLRSLVRTADVLSGRDAPRPLTSRTAAVKNLKAMASPEAKEYAALAEVSRMADLDQRTADGNVTQMVVGGLLPPEQFFRHGTRLINTPGKQSTGEDILRLHRSVMIATENIRTEYDEGLKRMLELFETTNMKDRRLVRRILEDPEYRELAMKENPVMYEKSMEFRKILNEWADKLQLDPDMRIENYFPWIYSTRAIEQLKKSGKIPDVGGIHIPNGSGIAEYKVMRNMLTRANDDPIGDLIDDPLEAGQIYLNGAVRKFHIDRLLADFDGDFFKRLSRAEPFIAAEMAGWVQDVVGVPRVQQLKYLALMRGIGLKLEGAAARLGFNSNEFTQEIIDKYFLSPAAPTRFTNFLRGFAFHSKIGGNLSSALVNLSQLGNTGTDLSVSSMLIGGIPYTLRGAQGKLAEGSLRRISGWIDIKSKGRKKLAMANKYGVWSDSTQNILDRVATQEFMHRGASGSLTLGAAAMGGIGGAMFLGDENGRGTGAATGASAVLAASLSKPGARAIRWALNSAKNTAMAPFEFAEFLNRGITAGAAVRTAEQTLKAQTSKSRRAFLRGEEVAEQVGIGAGAGAAAGALTGSEGERGDRAITGAIVGASAGGAFGLAGSRGGRVSRVTDELNFLTDNSGALPFRSALHSAGVPTEDEIARWYMRQVLDQTQFRFGREARSRWLRTPMGEIMGSLQSFTINQMEFTGQRAGAFMRSFTQAMGDSGGSVTKAVVSGKLDTRFFRHLMLITATGSALTALTASLDIDKGYEYWLSRIGMGLLPVISWNRDAEEWQLSDISAHLMGPVFSDIQAAYRTIFTLATDPVALRAWDTQVDKLARNTFSALRQMEHAPETVGNALEKAGQEGLADLAREQSQGALNVSRPAGTMRHGNARPSPRDGQGGPTIPDFGSSRDTSRGRGGGSF